MITISEPRDYERFYNSRRNIVVLPEPAVVKVSPRHFQEAPVGFACSGDLKFDIRTDGLSNKDVVWSGNGEWVPIIKVVKIDCLGGGLQSNASIYSFGSVCVEGSVLVRGNLHSYSSFVNADGDICVSGNLEAYADINSQGNIEACNIRCLRGVLIAVGDVVATETVVTAGTMLAATITAGEYAISYSFKIKTKRLCTQGLPFGYDYWDGYFGDVSFDEWIRLTESNKSRIRKLCEEEKNWIIRAHLEMFYGFRDEWFPDISDYQTEENVCNNYVVRKLKL